MHGAVRLPSQVRKKYEFEQKCPYIGNISSRFNIFWSIAELHLEQSPAKGGPAAGMPCPAWPRRLRAPVSAARAAGVSSRPAQRTLAKQPSFWRGLSCLAQNICLNGSLPSAFSAFNYAEQQQGKLTCMENFPDQCCSCSSL